MLPVMLEAERTWFYFYNAVDSMVEKTAMYFGCSITEYCDIRCSEEPPDRDMAPLFLSR
jgi:hypothetical protein